MLYTFGLQRIGTDANAIIGVEFDDGFNQDTYQHIKEHFVSEAIVALLSGSFGASPRDGEHLDIGWVGPKTIDYEGQPHEYFDCGTVVYQSIKYFWFLREAKANEFSEGNYTLK